MTQSKIVKRQLFGRKKIHLEGKNNSEPGRFLIKLERLQTFAFDILMAVCLCGGVSRVFSLSGGFLSPGATGEPVWGDE